MSFDDALGCLRQAYPFCTHEYLVVKLSTEHLFHVGQIRVAPGNAFEGGHILSLPLPARNICSLVEYHQKRMPVEPKPQKQSCCISVTLGGQSSGVVPVRRNTFFLELYKSENVNAFEYNDVAVDTLCQFGPCLAEACQTNIDKLCIVTRVSQVHSAKFNWKDDEEPDLCDITCTHSSSTSDGGSGPCNAGADVARNFHVRGLGQDLSVQEPWGMFVEDTESIVESVVDLDKAGIVEGKSFTERSFPNECGPSRPSYYRFQELASPDTYMAPYYQAAPGVDVIYSRYVEVDYLKVPASLAAAIQWIHDRFPDQAGERRKQFDDIGKSPMEFKGACSSV